MLKKKLQNRPDLRKANPVYEIRNRWPSKAHLPDIRLTSIVGAVVGLNITNNPYIGNT